MTFLRTDSLCAALLHADSGGLHRPCVLCLHDRWSLGHMLPCRDPPGWSRSSGGSLGRGPAVRREKSDGMIPVGAQAF